MAAPANRVPVRVARGTKANLTASLASLVEGEVCYATDENTLYVIEGGVLTVANGIIFTSIDALSDVNTTSTAPTSGQALKWSGTAWIPGNVITNLQADTAPRLGGPLDCNNFVIGSASNQDVTIAPDGTGRLRVRGTATGGSAAILLGSETNANYVSIKGPPNSAGANYTFTLPNDDGAARQVLSTDGSATTSWMDTLRRAAVPPTATSAGQVGDVAIDAAYLYICTATNTWVRAAVATW